MSLLSGTPYLLEPEERARAVIKSAQQIEERVHLLRRSGRLDPATLARLRHEWGVQQVYESAGIEGNSLTLSETFIASREEPLEAVVRRVVREELKKAGELRRRKAA